MKLSEELGKWRCDRPDEWKMDEFQRNAEKLEAERDALMLKASKFDWIAQNVQEVVHQRPSEFLPLKTKYALPLLIAYADFCGQIHFGEAVDIAINNELEAKLRNGEQK